MNGPHFVEWFQKQLLPNLPPHSVIVLDNAPYHNTVIEKVPVKSSTKPIMQNWLSNHGIPWDPKDLKKDLLEKIKLAAPQKRFEINEYAKRAGHTVLRSPVAHCELNPIELVWARVKDFLKKAKQNVQTGRPQTSCPGSVRSRNS